MLLTLILIFVLNQTTSSTSNDASNNNQCLQACLKGSFCSSLKKGSLLKGPAKTTKGRVSPQLSFVVLLDSICRRKDQVRFQSFPFFVK